MQEILGRVAGGDHPSAPWFQLLILMGYALVGSVLFNFLAIGILSAVYGSFEEVQAIISYPYADPGNRWALFAMQGILSLGLFVIAPLAYTRLNLNMNPRLFFGPVKQPIFYLLLFVSVFSLMQVNAIVVEWNESWTFPGALSGLEEALQSQEAELAELTNFLLVMDTPLDFWVALLVIAVLPGIGEELVFRGLVQNLLFKASKNAHVAIWVSAFLFSAIHLQFYGLVPRMLLGALFGYVYFWTGRLWMAILAHFLNNAISLLLVYLFAQDMIPVDPNATEAVPSWPYVILFATIGVITLYVFKQRAAEHYGEVADRL